MKIIQVSPYFYPHIGGVETHVRCLSEKLIKRGHEVSVITSKLSGETAEHEVIDGIEIYRIKPLLNRCNTPVMPRLVKAVLSQRADVVHGHIPPPFSEYFAARACKRKNIPYVITYHCDLEIPSIINKPVTGLYRHTIGRYALHHTDKIIVTTRTYGATSRAIWKFDPAIIPMAVDAVEFNPNNKGREEIIERYHLGDKKIVLYVGRIKAHKGLEQLVEYAKYTDKNIKYLIVGAGDLTPILRVQIKKLGVQDKIILTGKISNEDLPKYYAACDMFVLPSISRLEAFGIVGLEAMASGKPVIISDIPGVREVISDNIEGILVNPLDARDIADKITILCEDDKLRAQMGSAGRKRVEERFEWSKVVRQIEKVYIELVENKKIARQK